MGDKRKEENYLSGNYLNEHYISLYYYKEE